MQTQEVSTLEIQPKKSLNPQQKDSYQQPGFLCLEMTWHKLLLWIAKQFSNRFQRYF